MLTYSPSPGLHRERRVNRAEVAHAGALVEILVAVRLERGNPPRVVVPREDELGELVHDLEGAERLLRGELVAKSDAVVEDAEDDRHAPRRRRPGPIRGRLLEIDAELVVPVADVLLLAPRLGPRLVVLGAGARGDLQAARERAAFGEYEPEPRGENDVAIEAPDAVGRPVAPEGKRKLDRAVGGEDVEGLGGSDASCRQGGGGA